ncbi:50S ribosomal protein L11 methyltransferase [Chelativorans sp. SCAU2101]|uniref:Ribosomal protein L11 methyltransferase n=1 Tax=Chelativorans petroleitrophicus TaxID=2975484 RepID=A0A9X2XB24_9HYPH|nr:50S ribosomal protein L11 methyltransferase [Chelativorans petroleitrophicus]MCT8992058.1 50S ribosomal protein L11 methyltransferase [Chelativorans petroleitrophicus]
MPQTRFYLQCSGALARQAYQLLESAFEDDGFPLAVFAIDEERDLHEVSLYASETPDAVEARMKHVLAGLEGLPAIGRETLPDIDWVAHSLQGLHAVRAGRFLIHGAHEHGCKRAGEIGIEIEAGLAFGTGHHGTTAGCLEMIARLLKAERPRNALDLGTGSAVLAIAIARLARIPVLATDIDPVAVRVASWNVLLNMAGAWVKTVTAPGFHHPVFGHRKPFDLIVANILARPLMKMAPAMAHHLAPGGSLILSGILERQRRAVLAAYGAQRFRHITTYSREGWVTIHLKR